MNVADPKPSPPAGVHNSLREATHARWVAMAMTRDVRQCERWAAELRDPERSRRMRAHADKGRADAVAAWTRYRQIAAAYRIVFANEKGRAA